MLFRDLGPSPLRPYHYGVTVIASLHFPLYLVTIGPRGLNPWKSPEVFGDEVDYE